MFKVLTIANRKGGAGKSTCAAHLAIEAVQKGFKTLLVDLDPQGTLEEKIKSVKEKGFDLCIIDTPGDTSTNAVVGIKAVDLVFTLQANWS